MATASRSIRLNSSGSRSRAIFTASLNPPHHDQSGVDCRKFVSQITAWGSVKLPMKFFLKPRFMPFFTAIPASSCARVVVGKRSSRTPRWAIDAPNPTASSTAPPPIAITKLWRSMPCSSTTRTTRSTTLIDCFACSPPGTASTSVSSGNDVWLVDATRSVFAAVAHAM